MRSGWSRGPTRSYPSQLRGVLIATGTIVVLSVAPAYPQTKAPASGKGTPGTNPETLITPGKSVGLLRLGMTPSQVSAAWGTPSRTRHRSQVVDALDYTRRRVTLYVTGGKVYEIAVLSSAFATKQGIQVGTKLPAVTAAYGRPDCSKPVPRSTKPAANTPTSTATAYLYQKLGFVVVTVKDVVRAILIATNVKC